MGDAEYTVCKRYTSLTGSHDTTIYAPMTGELRLSALEEQRICLIEIFRLSDKL